MTITSDSAQSSTARWTALLCWLTVLLEGYDLVVLGAIIPTLIRTGYIGFDAAGATAAATFSLVGVAIGAAAVGPLADRYGRRIVLIGSVVLFSVFTLVIPIAPTVAIFVVLRFVAGLGLGACMPTALTIMSENLPARQRARASTLTMTGYHTGAVITSLLALWVADWHVLFYALGVAGMLMAVLMWFRLPESQEFVLLSTTGIPVAKKSRAATLLRPPYRRASLGVWVGSFMGLLLVYGLNSWLPTIMVEAGYGVGDAITRLLLLNAGGVVGLILSGFIADRRGTKGTALVWYGIGAVLLALLSLRMDDGMTALLNVLVFLTGVFVFSAQVLIYAYVAQVFPTAMRATALGLASAIGRIGSIVGPTITGALVIGGIAYPWGFYFFAAVAVLGLIAVAALPRFRPSSYDAIPRREEAALAEG